MRTAHTLPAETTRTIAEYAYPSFPCRLRLSTKREGDDGVQMRWSATTSSRGTHVVDEAMPQDDDMECQFRSECIGSRLVCAEIAALFSAYRAHTSPNANRVMFRLTGAHAAAWIEYKPNDNGKERVLFSIHDGSVWFDECFRPAGSTDRFSVSEHRDFSTEAITEILQKSRDIRGRIVVGDNFLGDDAKLCMLRPPPVTTRLAQLAKSYIR